MAIVAAHVDTINMTTWYFANGSVTLLDYSPAHPTTQPPTLPLHPPTHFPPPHPSACLHCLRVRHHTPHACHLERLPGFTACLLPPGRCPAIHHHDISQTYIVLPALVLVTPCLITTLWCVSYSERMAMTNEEDIRMTNTSILCIHCIGMKMM